MQELKLEKQHLKHVPMSAFAKVESSTAIVVKRDLVQCPKHRQQQHLPVLTTTIFNKEKGHNDHKYGHQSSPAHQ